MSEFLLSTNFVGENRENYSQQTNNRKSHQIFLFVLQTNNLRLRLHINVFMQGFSIVTLANSLSDTYFTIISRRRIAYCLIASERTAKLFRPVYSPLKALNQAVSPFGHFVEICHRSLPVVRFFSNCGNNESYESSQATK